MVQRTSHEDDFALLAQCMPALELTEGLQLLEVVMETAMRLPRKPPLLVLAGILHQARHEALKRAGTGHEVNIWSSVSAHMLHVYNAVMRQ